jgi:protein-S-isoprenylcysteine O-methyltransferase Ste14
MRRWTFFAYGVFCHLLFLAIYAALAGFVGNLLMPKTIDSEPPGNSIDLLFAGAVNLGLMGLFALQHSVMARPWFKERWTRLVPKAIERSTYVLLSCGVVALLMWQWRSIPVVVWDVSHPIGRAAMWGLFATGCLLVPAVSFLINHFDLFGTRQVWLHLKGKPYEVLEFRTPGLYRSMRHPLYVGWTIAFFATPTMTVGHLLFAVVMTAYMGIAVLFEERDLTEVYGEQYRDYQQRVPMFLPRLSGPKPAPKVPELAGK